jgi:hypothetical protein
MLSPTVDRASRSYVVQAIKRLSAYIPVTTSIHILRTIRHKANRKLALVAIRNKIYS